MVITSPSKHLCFDCYKKFKKGHEEGLCLPIEIFSENIHPQDAEFYGKKLSESRDMIICFNTVVLDYVDLNELYAITEDLLFMPFREMYKEELEFMYPGEIVLNKCCE